MGDHQSQNELFQDYDFLSRSRKFGKRIVDYCALWRKEMADKSDRNITDADRKCPDNINSAREPPVPLKPLAEGEKVGKKWKIVRQIEPELGFNTIYVVEHEKKNFAAALKIETKNAISPTFKLELFILLHMEANDKTGKTRRFPRVFERGQMPDYNYIVVTLCGKNLKTLRKETEYGKLSPACGLHVGLQCLQALEDLHKLGFIHRTINPSDFAIGRVEDGDVKELRTIYLLDFGFARQYKEADGKHKPPRPQPWIYKGSARYASRNAFLRNEMSRLDDLEMCLYMVVELVKGSLPWVAYREPKQIFEYQKAVRTGLPLLEFLGGLPTEMITLMKQIDSLQYKEEPKYAEMMALVEKAIQKTEQQPFPYDWEKTEQAPAAAPKEDPGQKTAQPLPPKK